MGIEDDEKNTAFASMSIKRPHEQTYAPRKENRDDKCYRFNRPGHIARKCRTKLRSVNNRNAKQQTNGQEERRDNKQIQGQSRSNLRNLNFSGAFASAIREDEHAEFEALANYRLNQVLPTVKTQDLWLSDSDASRHISFRKDCFGNLTYTQGDKIVLGDNNVKSVAGVDSIRIKRFIKGE